MPDSIVLLGCTGSIGVNTLEIASRYAIPIEALVAGSNIGLLNRQISIYHPRYVAIARKEDRDKIDHGHVFCGNEGILELLELTKSPLVVNALVGYTGLAPTIKAIEMGRRVALANKESLVVAGEFLDLGRITPIDSEHFGLWYLMHDRPYSKLYITASGGAFRDWPYDQIANATFADALKHPNWSMGKKITIDSATMINKLFELLEAKWLFDTDNIDAVIERKSIVHALVAFKDGSTVAHFAGVDMKLPIAFALKGEVDEEILPPLDPLMIGTVRFEPIESIRYPIWEIKEHLLANPHLGAVVNAANEEAIKLFESGRCGFFELARKVLDAYRRFESVHPASINDIFAIDKEVRDYVNRF
jgi:1-deoxy-D-xylulose-5-phosphate reductoisomerase